ncbi:MAG: sugar nucleotide-binding protein, partial [Gammaproteobacteria bacterium]|nr:sugar nucleotide-binding protein [Gammaproteobacteria bacterium]
LRTNIFGWNIIDKKSIAEWFLSNLQEKRLMKGFTDVYFSSIYTLSLAELIDECLKKNLSGIFNCACQDSMTKFQFGQRLADIFGLDQSLIEPITLNEAKLNAPRGKDLRLDVNRLSEVLDQKIPSMENCLQRFHSDWCNDLPLKMKTLS